MPAKMHSISSLSVELGIDRRTLSKRLTGIQPDGKSGRAEAWLMTTAVEAVLKDRRAPSGGNVSEFKSHKERLEAAQADKAELQVKLLSGDLVPADAVERAWSTTFAVIRDLIRATPMGCVDRLLAAAEDGRPALKAALEAELDEVLSRASQIEVVVEADDDGGEGAAKAA